MGTHAVESEVGPHGPEVTLGHQPVRDVRTYIVDNPQEGMFTVDRALFSDPELFELEWLAQYTEDTEFWLPAWDEDGRPTGGGRMAHCSCAWTSITIASLSIRPGKMMSHTSAGR